MTAKEALDALDNFLTKVQRDCIDVMIANKSRMALHKELRECTQYRDLEVRMVSLSDALISLKENHFLRDRLTVLLHATKTSAMTQFLLGDKIPEHAQVMNIEELLEPYKALPTVLESVRILQVKLLTRARLRRTALDYDELSGCLTEMVSVISGLSVQISSLISRLKHSNRPGKPNEAAA